MKHALIVVLLALVFPSSIFPAELSAADLDKRRKALRDLLHEQWEDTLKRNPEFASLLGDKRYNDLLNDPSGKAVRAGLAASRAFLARFESIDVTGFSSAEKLDKQLMVLNLRNDIADAKFRDWLMPVNQMGGIHLWAAQFPSLLSFTTTKDYDDWIARLKALPRVMDATIENMRQGMKSGLIPPRFLLEKVATQADEMAKQKPEETPFARPTSTFPDTVSAADRERIHKETLDVVRTSVLPAYARFAKFVRDEYAPRGYKEVGVWAFPDGAARYANKVKRQTTTDLTPAEIHEIGLREVARIEGDMLAIARKLGFEDLKSFNKALEANPDLRPKSREQILEIYRGYIDQMYAKLPELFGRLPKARVVVVATEAFREKESAGADYDPGAPDGSRPGRVNVNTYDPTSRKTISMESTAYHEGVPGHHMQISIAQELPDTPEFRKQGGYTAYVEGWALYSERLGKEVGFYQNPYSDYGRLQDEMLRAIRLVVDTGLHDKKWTREQVVQYFHDHSALDEVEVQSETDRYIVWPGQALAYKIGQLEITRLRDEAQKKLGPKFDIRAFHDEVLGAGALPLEVLAKRIGEWVEKASQ